MLLLRYSQSSVKTSFRFSGATPRFSHGIGSIRSVKLIDVVSKLQDMVILSMEAKTDLQDRIRHLIFNKSLAKSCTNSLNLKISFNPHSAVEIYDFWWSYDTEVHQKSFTTITKPKNSVTIPWDWFLTFTNGQRQIKQVSSLQQGLIPSMTMFISSLFLSFSHKGSFYVLQPNVTFILVHF